ncbi:MAG TPA: cytochrome c biogenesis protein CcsA [Spirochaetota bacterium]|nr:cytochrome c biogenesis protein CcsA [Spirochaetota bacterium]HPC39350.1 cytochrome c biogenesis protein CcsA [Spirochaetota bacterium]HPL15157.1 cytochrome c biogenesis protein CcsA [Spirochaetota bacterium]HQF08712.1 cytochrome c biogenesis protein CcsA [Spirochaetota bacterium]HQH97587.1 cytochrome c biogenesis protein CcsA [Spirochaetota bacterium]
MNFSTSMGNIVVIAALFISLAAIACAILDASGKQSFLKPAGLLYQVSGGAIALAVFLLLYYFIDSDFRFVYVYENSSRDLALPYRIAAFWAGKEGSFLLWLFFLNIFGLLIAKKSDNPTGAVSSVILLSQIFILVILIVESPFTYMWDKFPENFSPGLVPGDGAGLTPLLKDPWMVAHPPVLFLGYASSTIVFAYAVDALVKKEYREWIERSYPWLLFSMVTLGIGIFLGGYWAYTVLGWGGYWGWDPVENSSLIPWLISIALVHGFILQRRSGHLSRTTIALALLYFITVFYSTWLTRSGVLSNFSVHSFSASEVAKFLLAFLLIYAVSAAALFAVRFKTITGARVDTPAIDWKTVTVYGIIVLVLYALVILAGTSMPLLSQLFMARPTNVTSSFYNNFSLPLGMIIIVLMFAATTLIITKKNDLPGRETIAAVTAAIILGLGINWGFTASVPAYLFSMLAVFLILRALIDLLKTGSRALLPSRLTHIGVGFLVLGIITSGFHTTSVQKNLEKGKTATIGDLSITFTGFIEGRESHLRFTVRDNGRTTGIKTAYYFDEKTQSIYKEPYILPGFFNDIYIAPENYESGSSSVTSLIIAKGEEKVFSGLKVRFSGFRTEHMTSGEPSTYADIVVNGIPLSPGLAFSRGALHPRDQGIPGTDRTVSLRDIDATSKKILLHITPGKNIAVPEDSVMVTVTRKRLIWMVWLGTLLISSGGAYGFGRALRRNG